VDFPDLGHGEAPIRVMRAGALTGWAGAGTGVTGRSAVTRLTLTCTALLIVVGSEVIPSLELLSGRAREPPRPAPCGRPATTRTRESAQRQAEGQLR